MDTNKNSYTIIYAVIMVIVVAVVLALAASLLKERQQRNVEIERKQMILKSVKLASEASAAADKDSYIEQEYAKYITDSSIVRDGAELTLYICNSDNGEKFYVIPVRGAGLWGPVWGYVSLKDDYNTIYGAVFDHKSETPGLGAEISTDAFASQFGGKSIFDSNGNYVSVKVVKGGAKAGSQHEVDAISGGTITSQAVEEMLFKNINEYLDFFSSQAKTRAEAIKAMSEAQAAADSLSVTNQMENN